MNQVSGKALRFHCCLLSSFHTTRQEYASLWKCAPFILGSTIRGALLQHLITTTYPQTAIDALARLSEPQDVADFHRRFEASGPVRAFFDDQPGVVVSFGVFRDEKGNDLEPEQELRGLTRIAIERGHASVAAGAIVNLEVIAAGTAFDFELLLPGDNGALTARLEQAVRQMAEVGGLGGLRSIGLGRFTVEKVETLDLWEQIIEAGNEMRSPLEGVKAVLNFTTPYVLGSNLADPSQLAARLNEQWQRALAHANYVSEDAPLFIQQVEAQVKPEFIGKWSYERGKRDNRLVAWPGSRVTIELSHIPFDWREQLALASLFGLGEWSEVGFGRFEVLPPTDLQRING